MKKLLFSLLAFLPLVVMAQQFGSGYYRVQNTQKHRFFWLVDNRAYILAAQSDVDVGAIKLVLGFEEKVAWNPSTICYLDHINSVYYNIKGNGMDLYQTVGVYMIFEPSDYVDGAYMIFGEGTVSGVTLGKYLHDSMENDSICDLFTNGDKKYRSWYVRPVDNEYYFGIKTDFEAQMYDAPSRYYTTMYASFPFSLNSNVKAYYPTEISGEYVKVEELTTAVPGATPVIMECTSNVTSQNKVDLLTSTSASAPGNKLGGTYYCNDVKETTKHRNVVDYKPATMRVLGRAADGRLAFVTSPDLKYIPANKAYLTVPAGTPETLYVVKEIPSGIEQVQSDVKPVRKGVFTLSGQRVADTTDGLSHGVYIVDGQKVVVN